MSVHQMRPKEPDALPSLAVISRIVERARKDAELFGKLKNAYLSGDREREHELVREYCGLPPEQSPTNQACE